MKQTIRLLKENFINDAESFLTEIRKLETLNNQQLNWKPSMDKWSIAECVDHLTVTNKLYLDKIEYQLSLKKIHCDDSKELVRHKILGKLIIKSVDPSNLKPTKTFKVFYPTSSQYDNSVLKNLIETELKLIHIVKNSVNSNFNNYIISSPVSGIIKENLCDVFEIIRLHNKRHLLQIDKLLSLAQFPGSYSVD